MAWERECVRESQIIKNRKEANSVFTFENCSKLSGLLCIIFYCGALIQFTIQQNPRSRIKRSFEGFSLCLANDCVTVHEVSKWIFCPMIAAGHTQNCLLTYDISTELKSLAVFLFASHSSSYDVSFGFPSLHLSRCVHKPICNGLLLAFILGLLCLDLCNISFLMICHKQRKLTRKYSYIYTCAITIHGKYTMAKENAILESRSGFTLPLTSFSYS